jgi:YcxB-like protein
MFCFLIAMVFVRGRKHERTLSISEQGIATEMESVDARLPWTKVKEVKDSGTYILIVGQVGNSFFVPSRAFHGSEERARFLSEIRRWHCAA